MLHINFRMKWLLSAFLQSAASYQFKNSERTVNCFSRFHQERK